jgi:hypothetical protein
MFASRSIVMYCLLCASANQAEFGTEILVHFRGLKNLNKPIVWLFPKLLVCLDCGFSRFTIPETELAFLAGGNATTEARTGQGGRPVERHD